MTSVPPDLLVTDLGLPGMDGLELLQIIRTKSPNIPAVAVTGYARLGDRARALGCGISSACLQAHRSGLIRAGAGGCRIAGRIATAGPERCSFVCWLPRSLGQRSSWLKPLARPRILWKIDI